MKATIGILIDENTNVIKLETIIKLLKNDYEVKLATNYNVSIESKYKIQKFDLFESNENVNVSHIKFLSECSQVLILTGSKFINEFMIGVNETFLHASLSAFTHNIYFCVEFENIELATKLSEISTRFKLININEECAISKLINNINETHVSKPILAQKILFIDKTSKIKLDQVRVVTSKASIDDSISVISKLINEGAHVTWVSDYNVDLRGCFIIDTERVNELCLNDYNVIVLLEDEVEYAYENQINGKISSKVEFNIQLKKSTMMNLKLANTITLSTTNMQIKNISENFNDKKTLSLIKKLFNEEI